MEKIECLKSPDACDALDGYSLMQTFSSRLLYPLSTYFSRKVLFRIEETLSENYWSDRWWKSLNTYCFWTLLDADREAAGVFLKEPVIKHGSTGKDVFARRLVRVGGVIGYSYRSLVCYDLCEQSKLEKTYAEVTMEVTVEHLSLWAFYISTTIIEGRPARRTTWIAPLMFCCLL